MTGFGGKNLLMEFKVNQDGSGLEDKVKVLFHNTPGQFIADKFDNFSKSKAKEVGTIASELVNTEKRESYIVDDGTSVMEADPEADPPAESVRKTEPSMLAPPIVPETGPSVPAAAPKPNIGEFNDKDFTAKFSINDKVQIFTGKMDDGTTLVRKSYTIKPNSIVEIKTTKVGRSQMSNLHSVTILDNSNNVIDKLIDVETSSIKKILTRFEEIVTTAGGKRARRKSSKRKSAKHKRSGRRGRRKSNKHRR